MYKRGNKGRGKAKGPSPQSLPVIRPKVAGIDIGSREHWVCGPGLPDGGVNVRVFFTTTSSLNQLADWLIEQGVESVAMESTYVYWIPVYELLESRGLEVVLVNARQLHNVPGRKTDMQDCQWLQLLHSCGLLRGAFRNHRCKKSEEEIAEHLTGTWRDEHLFNLASALRLHDTLQAEVELFDQ